MDPKVSDTQAIAARLTALPRRTEYLGGQQFSYIKLDDALAITEDASAHVETLTQQVADKFGGDALVIEAREGEKRMLAKLEDCQQENARLTAALRSALDPTTGDPNDEEAT